jgi:hypothetical protein
MKPEAPKDLLFEIARGNCVAFIGAGPSKAAGFPDWYQLMLLMIDWAEKQRISIPNRLDIQELIDKKKDFLAAADAMRANMGDVKYHEFLTEIFTQTGTKPTDFHRLLVQIPFVAVATTNYECLIEAAYKEADPTRSLKVFAQVDHEQLGVALNSKDFFVLKAHGSIERPESIVLGKADYRKLIHASPGYRTFLKALFLDRAVLFLGFGMSDPELLVLLDELKELFGGKTPTHHALLDVSHTTETEQQQFEQYYSVRIIPYKPSVPNHPEVAEFLEELITKLPRYILAHTMTHALEPAKRVLDAADPHYRLVMSSDKEFVIREKYEGASKAKPLKLSMRFKFDSKKAEDREAHEALKKLLATGEPATIKSPHLAEFVPPEVLSVLMPERFDEMQVTMGPVVGQNSMTVRAIVESNDGESVVLENIELKNIQGGTEQMILSNEHQDVPWKFRQVIRFDEGESEVNFTFNSVNVPIKQAVKGLRFSRALSKGGSLRIESEQTDGQLSHAKIPSQSFPTPNEQWIQICEAIESIQRRTGTLFKSPEVLRVDDAKAIAVVAEILRTGKATMMPPTFDVSRDEAENFLSKSSAERPLSLTNYFDEWVSIVLGQRISLGPVLITGEKLYIKPGDAEIVHQELESNLGSELIPVKLTPVAGTVLDASYPQWLPEEEARIVLNLPFVRTASLKNLFKMLLDAAKGESQMVDSDAFIELLEDALEESTRDGVLINPLRTATIEELTEAFDSASAEIDEETRSFLRLRLSEVTLTSVSDTRA